MERPVINCDRSKTRVKQEPRDVCDINKIIAKYKKTGNLPISHIVRTPRYGDFSQLPDYQGYLNSVLSANAAYDNLPEKIKSRFRHAIDFADFCCDSKNRDELVAMGLIKPADVDKASDPVKPGVDDKNNKDKGGDQK